MGYFSGSYSFELHFTTTSSGLATVQDWSMDAIGGEVNRRLGHLRLINLRNSDE